MHSQALIAGRGKPAGFGHKLTICFVLDPLSLHHQTQAGLNLPTLSFLQQCYHYHMYTSQRGHSVAPKTSVNLEVSLQDVNKFIHIPKIIQAISVYKLIAIQVVSIILLALRSNNHKELKTQIFIYYMCSEMF